MDRDEVRAYVARDWDVRRQSKRAYWAGRSQRDGWRPAWDAAQALLAHVRRIRLDYPSDDDRARDLEHHCALRAQFDRVSHAFTDR